MRDIQTRQQVLRWGRYRKKRERGKRKTKGGKSVGKVVDILCWIVLIFFLLALAAIALFVIGMIVYFHSELERGGDGEPYSEQQRIEDEIQLQALKEDAEKREAKKKARKERKKKRWTK